MSVRKRRKRRGSRIGCTAAVLLFLVIAAAAAYGLPWAVQQLKTDSGKIFGQTVEQVVSVLDTQNSDTSGLTVKEDEVSDHFYYRQLDQKEQLIYRELVRGIRDMEKCIELQAGKEDHPEDIYEYVLFDCPEFFWCTGSSQMTVYEERTEFCPEYSCSAEEKQQRQADIDSAAAEVLNGIGTDTQEYDKIRYVYEYLIRTVDYDENAPDNQNIYSALAGKKSVCAGYSRAAQYLLNSMGIECIYVIGTAGNQVSHAWNIVKCDGKYYQMDVTFGDPVFLEEESGESLPENIIYYDYLCCTDEEIRVDHVQSTAVDYPVCDSEDLNYYRRNGMYYEEYDPQILLNALNDSIYAENEVTVFKFPDEEVYARARKGLIEDLYPKAAQTLGSVYGLGNVRYTYVEDPQHCKIMVFWYYQ